jgi:hypothetical protein
LALRVPTALLALMCAVTTGTVASATPPAVRAAVAAPEDGVARIYRQALLMNTPVMESTWDAAAGTYRIPDFYFGGVLGNAVLLTYGEYDEQLATVSAATLRDHTVRTIRAAAAQSRWVTPSGTWGGRVYWDSTFESYFVAAARLLWSELDATTRSRVDTIVRSSADNIVSVGSADVDGWSTNGLAGGYAGDSKIEEMGMRSMPLAAALAWLPGDAQAGQWRQWHTRWLSNMGGLPVADRANPTVLNGRAVSAWNTAHNTWDTFLVENHGSWSPIYQQSVGGYPGRNAVHFLLAGRPLPEELRQVPNSDELWETMARLGTDSGVAQSFTVADRHHLYGRTLLPITARAMLVGDRYAARAEQMLADRLIPYVRYAPAGRLTKFSGEPKYEPEARAEIAMAYLLHVWRDRLSADVVPVSEAEYFTHFAGSVDYGAGPGLVAHSTSRTLAAAVTKPGFVKYAYLPQHDDWLFDVAGRSPTLLPSVDTQVSARSAHAYTRVRDGVDASATAVRTPTGIAGFTTLPDGSMVYATSGLAAGEGRLNLYNLSMPGVPGLDGHRTFTWAGGSVDLAGVAGGGVHDLRLAATPARYVRMTGVRAATQYGFSAWEMAVHSGTSGNLAAGRPASASSADPRFPAASATDGDASTRWAVAGDQRSRPGWLTVDLGTVRSVDRVVLNWEAAYPSHYRVEVSTDARTWQTAATVADRVTAAGDWLNVDGRAGFAVRGGTNPISVASTGVVLCDGPATGCAGIVIEGYPAQSPAETAQRASAPSPRDLPAGLAASLAGGHLSIFNLGASGADGASFTVPQPTAETVLYQGVQQVGVGDTTRYIVTIPAADARVTPARFTATDPSGGPLRPGTGFSVHDSRTVDVTAPADAPAEVRLRSLGSGVTVTVTAGAGQTVRADVAGPLTPTSDLARGRTTFPTSPLPPGMTDPAHAVDGDPATSWTPGGAGRRMVVDLRAARAIGAVSTTWSSGLAPATRIETSTDGSTFQQYVAGATVTARYVALIATTWNPGDDLASLVVLPPGPTQPALVPAGQW